MKPLRSGLAAMVLAGLASQAGAQHADFVLFGKDFKGSTPAAYQPQHRFVHPMTSPYFHEDSFVTTDIRAYFLYHDFPTGGVINGGTAKVYAAQVRVALTDTLQLVAYKDGYTDLDAGLSNDSGYNDIAAGLKWNFLQNWEQQLHAAVGAGYEFPVGDPSVLHNNGEVRFWGSVNKGFDRLHLGLTGNVFFGTSGDEPLGNSDYLSWHAHVDYYVCDWFSPTVELNGYHTFNPNDEVVGFSGIDVTNLGGGDDVVTMAVGAEIRPTQRAAIRAAYEFPLTDGDDLYGYRITASLVLSF
ncbi:MAG TPA: hypothetical protein PLD59_16850 [Tepidisphaeraceae bacterium]|nr:hypothetical protein [Tepidisphaeraceae bacterium]